MEKIDFLNSEIPNLISVIIPAYNSAKYLQPMLDSIYCQTYTNFEIIIAYDEKSTDNTLEILNRNVCNHNLIIDVGNDTSPGVARNRGARLASGAYILFLDADDLIIPSYFEQMIHVFKQYPELDVVHFGFVKTDEMHARKIYLKKQVMELNIRLSSTTDILPIFFFIGFGMPWNWLVKRAFLIDNHIGYKNYTWGEDTVYSFQLLTKTNRIGVIDEPGYIWIQHPSSLTSSKKNTWKLRRNNRLKTLDDMFDVMSVQYPELYPMFKWNYNLFCERDCLYSIRNFEYHTFRSVLEEVNIQKLECIEYDSLADKINIACFNHAKLLYWLIHKILKD